MRSCGENWSLPNIAECCEMELDYNLENHLRSWRTVLGFFRFTEVRTPRNLKISTGRVLKRLREHPWWKYDVAQWIAC